MTDSLKPLANVAQFNNAAQVYDGARPPYFPKQLAHILREAGVGPDDDIAEIGSGTGGLSRAILDSNHPFGKLYCIELNPGMRAQAGINLATEVSGGKVEIIAGRVEAMNLPDCIKPKLLIGGDMAHWVWPPEPAAEEMKNKLGSNGKVAIIVRYPDPASPMVRRLHDLLERHCFSYKGDGANKLLNTDIARLNTKQGKHLVEEKGAKIIIESLPQERTPDALFRYMASRSSTTPWAMPPKREGEDENSHAKRLKEAKERVYKLLIDPLYKEFGQDGVMPLPYIFHAVIGDVKQYDKSKMPLDAIRERPNTNEAPGRS